MDLKLTEQGNGGDFNLNTNDLALVFGVENMPYLAMFGGNNYFGNFLLSNSRRFMAETEQVLISVPLNSQGRVTIEEAIKRDLQFLIDTIPGTTLDVRTRIADDNTIEIRIYLNGEQIEFLWNPVTQALVKVGTCPVVSGLSNTALTSTTLTFTWTGAGGIGYQYAYNLTGDTPTVWTNTTANNVTLTGLTPDAEYFFFVRTRCSGGVFSAVVSASAITDAAAPEIPITEQLILALFASYGVERTGSDVTKWNDISGVGNHMYPGGDSPQWVDDTFGAEAGVVFDDSVTPQSMSTSGDLIGLDIVDSCTIFVVIKHPAPSGGRILIGYSPGSLSVNGTFESYTQMPVATPEITALLKGNAGINVGVISSESDTATVFTYTFDFTQTGANEIKMLRDDSVSDFSQIGSNNNTNQFSSQPLRICEGKETIGAILMYKNNLSDSDKTIINNWLIAKYSI